MATVTGITAEKAAEIEENSIVDAEVDSAGVLWFKNGAGDPIYAGVVRGADGVGPTGSIIMTGADTAPMGWLLCDGSAVSRSVYSALFAVIGTKFGAGNGSTTFNLPDMRTRVPMGKGASAPYNVVGNTGGEATHVLTADEMPTHTHTQNAHNHLQNAHTHTQNAHNHVQDAHNHTGVAHNHSQNAHSHGPPTAGYAYGFYQGAGTETVGEIAGTGWYIIQATGDVSASTTTGSTTATNNSATGGNNAATATNQASTAVNQNTTATNIAVTATNNDTGGGLAHNNLQPYLVLNYLIKN